MKEGLIELIKQRGYWRIDFYPPAFQENRLGITQCKKIIERNNISLRGWDYPHIEPSGRTDGFGESGAHNNYYESCTDWGGHIEFWQMYQSGQFLHYRALAEDWQQRGREAIEERVKSIPVSSDDGFIPKEPFVILDIDRAVFQITEVFEFIRRLVNDTAQVYEEGLQLSVGLFNTEKRVLFLSNFMQGGLLREYKTLGQSIELSYSFNKGELLLDSAAQALKVILDLFDRFDWEPSHEVIKNTQDKLLKHNR